MDAAQLRDLERLCEQLYTAHDAAARQEAEENLLPFSENAAYIPQCQFILDTSEVAYAQLLASSSLRNLVTNNWNSFTTEQRVDIRNYLLSYLANRGPQLAPFVAQSVTSLLCRITKLGWFDDDAHREIVDDVSKFLQATVSHCILGLRILIEMVGEMTVQSRGRSLTLHRKTATSFRDKALLDIFKMALTTLRQLLRGEVSTDARRLEDIKSCSVQLSVKCLQFDFMGTSFDQSSEETGSIQMPPTWRALMQTPETTTMFFDLYAQDDSEYAPAILECIMQLGSVRKSLFSSKENKTAYVARIMEGQCNILRSGTGLDDAETFHAFCRMLARMRGTYQQEIAEAPWFREWIDLVAKFTIKAFELWQWSTNSVYFLLATWARLVQLAPYLRNESNNYITTFIPRLVDAYVASRLETVRSCMVGDMEENPLDEACVLQEQLASLPQLVRLGYERHANHLASLFTPRLNVYQQCLPAVRQGNEAALQQLECVEGELSWLCMIVGAIIGQHRNSGSEVDGLMASRVLQVMVVSDERMMPDLCTVRPESLGRLNRSLLLFFSTFRRTYIGDQSLTQSEVYENIGELLNLTDHMQVLRVIIDRVLANLKLSSGDNDGVVKETLKVLGDFSSGHSTCLMMSKLTTVQFLLTQHGPREFPFMENPNNFKNRTTFHQILAQVLFAHADGTDMIDFDSFMQPQTNVIMRLASFSTPQEFHQPGVKAAVIGLLRDLRGVCLGCPRRRQYRVFFEFVHPNVTGLLVRIAEVFGADEAVTSPLLKFWAHFVHSQSNRITFDVSSPNGILLFRETSRLVCAYGEVMLATDVPLNSGDIYRRRYKGISTVYLILFHILGGGYTNFGVFELYGDPAFRNVLDMVLKMVRIVPLDELLAFPKLCRNFFRFLEMLFRNHFADVAELEPSMFEQLMDAVEKGVQSLDVQTSTQAAHALDHFAIFYHRSLNNKKRACPSLQRTISSMPGLMPRLLSVLFNITLYGNASNFWSLAQPMVGLILTNTDAYETMKKEYIASQPPQRAQELTVAFEQLMSEVENSVGETNKTKFTQNYQTFRQKVRQFIV